MNILKSYEIFESFEILRFFFFFFKLNFEIFWNFWNFELKKKIIWNFVKILTFFCNLIGQLEMKSRLWLDNVETPNRQ